MCTTTQQNQRFQNKVVVITGAASGIGKALAESFSKEGGLVVVADLCQDAVTNVAKQIGGGWAYRCDVTVPVQVQEMIRAIRKKWGRIDIYCSNAGIMIPPSSSSSSSSLQQEDASAYNDHVARLSDAQWERVFRVNVQSHVIAIRELITDKDAWDGGVFVVTASAAGLLAMVEDAFYGISKAAAVSFSEHLAIVHPQIQVHCLCPQAVDTPFFPEKFKQVPNSTTVDGLVTPSHVAECTMDSIENKSFWVFPHKNVSQYIQFKVSQHARWLNGMQRLRKRLRREYNKIEMVPKMHSKL